ncbi:MAG: hypothetical protein J3Q66DRAFT_361241 [Benniella sp.]|nr:MAG: hypothetical protein J3Q66DRAFT_361241 [Benniella sp.]
MPVPMAHPSLSCRWGTCRRLVLLVSLSLLSPPSSLTTTQLFKSNHTTIHSSLVSLKAAPSPPPLCLHLTLDSLHFPHLSSLFLFPRPSPPL